MTRKSKFFRYVSLLLSFLFFVESVPLYAAEMKDYCIIPPYVKRDVKPNILIMMDNSTNMGNPAYTGSYDPGKTYSGLFNPDLIYTYGSNRWLPDDGTLTADPDNNGQPGIYSGNLLNWATTSQYDLLQSILVGGKSASRQTNVNTLQSMSTSWTKVLSYIDMLGRTRTCVFIVNNANVEIRDDTPESCGYLDSPAYTLIGSLEHETMFAENRTENEQEGLMDKVLKNIAEVRSLFVDFLIPDAEAAAPLRLPGGVVLSEGAECASYSTTITASGGTEVGYTWSVSGSLPPGLSMDANDTPSTTITGTPTTSGTYNFTVQVCDSAGCIDKHTATETYSITIRDAPITITTAVLDPGAVGVWYRKQILSSGACASSTTWSVASGSLPPGLSLGDGAANYIYLYGTPTTSGTYTFVIRVTDEKNNTATKSFTVIIGPAAGGGLTITTVSPLPAITVGTFANILISAAGSSCAACCSCTWQWSITAGSLPPGMSFNTGSFCPNGDHTYIYGTPTVAGTYNFTISVTDCNGVDIRTKNFTLAVGSAPVTIRTTGNRSVKICAGTYVINCSNVPGTNTGPPCAASDPTRCVLKSGIVDEFWPNARLGIEDFSRVASDAIPEISNCIEVDQGAYPDSDFLTTVENAIPISVTTTLVNGMYKAVDYYANDTSSNCNPFRSSESCQRNFALMITSGFGADNPPNPSGDTPDVFTDDTNCTSSNLPPASYNLAKNSCFGYNNDLRNSPTFGGDNLLGRQIINTYVVNTMGATRDNDPSTHTAGDILYQAANAGGGVYYEVTDPATLKQYLVQAFQDILKRAAAGTAASVLASGEGSGANLIQAVFYPRRKIFDTEIAWTGRLTNFWYFVDPFFGESSIFEDNGDPTFFDRSQDNRVSFFFDSTLERTMAHRYPPSGSSTDVPFENLNTLWEAGLRLWERTSQRTIKVSAGSGLIDFSTGNASTLEPLFALPTIPNPIFADGDLNHDGSVDSTDASILIRYVHGEDFPSYTWMRSRTVGIDLSVPPDNDIADAGEEPKVWKLGDILNSTPKISSWIPLNTYDQTYLDVSYGAFLDSSTYTDRGMVFAGGNDGMLHAFKLGKLELKNSPVNCSFGDTDIACLANPAGYLGGAATPLGHEMWAFIPKNVLPYLKYVKEPDYCHIFTVDLSPYIFDASIGLSGSGDISGNDRPNDGSTWRTILIGGMRFGGACKNSCTTADCVKTPANDLGYSTYFALDVTDQSNPELLWEFSDENLGFTTTGPVIVREGDRTKNAKWFVIFGSGPTGPISTTDQQFLARSDQNLRLFILDLKTGSLARTIDTGISNAFAGSMINSSIDVDLDYQDDVVYIGYVKKNSLTNTWTQGGIGRLQTKESASVADWAWSTVLDDVGPVTSAVTRLINKNKGQLWIFFGSGRYYFEQQATVDDENGQRTLFGITDPCYSTTGIDSGCTSAFNGTITDVTNIPDADTSAIADGWQIDLDPSGNYSYCELFNDDGSCAQNIQRYYRAERVITDPLSSISGLVFFVSYKPYSDVCAYGGKSFIWAVRYNTGGAPGALLKGIALLQVSTGSIEQVDLSAAFTEKGGRRTTALEGVPPTAQGISILSTPPPVKRVLHIKER